MLVHGRSPGNELGGKLRPNKRADKAHLEALAQQLAACSRLKELDLSGASRHAARRGRVSDATTHPTTPSPLTTTRALGREQPRAALRRAADSACPADRALCTVPSPCGLHSTSRCAGRRCSLTLSHHCRALRRAGSNLGPVGCSVVADALLSLPDLQLLDLNCALTDPACSVAWARFRVARAHTCPLAPRVPVPPLRRSQPHVHHCRRP